jgi:hypothetical protein
MRNSQVYFLMRFRGKGKRVDIERMLASYRL